MAVLVVITIAALAGTSAMYLAGAQAESARASLKRTQARAMAWSGVQAVMAELAGQRDELLDGEPPRVTREWTLFEDQGSGVRGQVWVVVAAEPAGTEEGSWSSRGTDEGSEADVLVSETGKLDINTATEDMLKATGLFDEATVAKIVAERSAHPFGSVEELLRVDGVTSEALFGAEASAKRESQWPGGTGEGAKAGGAAGSSGPLPRGADVLTVFSFDPNIQGGWGDAAAEFRGRLRINLNTKWSDRLGRAVDERFGEGTSAGLKNMMEGGRVFKTTADIVHVLIETGMAPEDWPAILDAVTATEDPYVLGRVDLNLAPVEVLACVPGVDATAAKAIVEARSRLDSEQRRTVAWPVIQGVLTKEQFEKAADWLTTRTMQWRVRVEAGFARGDRGGGFDESGTGDSGGESRRLEQRVVLEAVIDVSSERARVAYLRDVSMLDASRAMYAKWRADAAADRTAEAAEPAPDEVVKPPPIEGGAAPALADGAGPGDEAPGDGPEATPDMLMPGEGEAAASKVGPAPEEAPPPPGVDRRRGRWTTGNGGGK